MLMIELLLQVTKELSVSRFRFCNRDGAGRIGS